MSKKPTASLLTAMTRHAKQRAKATNTPHNATLEDVARQHGFQSWHSVMRLHKAAAAITVPANVLHLPLDPVLPAGFDDTQNEDRSDAEIERWWMRPFAITRSDGLYEVRCLDGGAWDRSTWYGIAKDMDDARKLAATKLTTWQSFMGTPTMTTEDGEGYLLTVEPLRPGFSRVVLANLPDYASALAWLEEWLALLSSDPESAQLHLAQARMRANKLDDAE